MLCNRVYAFEFSDCLGPRWVFFVALSEGCSPTSLKRLKLGPVSGPRRGFMGPGSGRKLKSKANGNGSKEYGKCSPEIFENDCCLSCSGGYFGC